MNKRKLILSLAGLIILTGRILPQIPANGLVGFYPFNGNAYDESGNGYNGNVNGADAARDRCNIDNSAFNFNGSFDFINIGDINAYDGSQALTISAWIFTDGNIDEHSGTIISKYSTAGESERVFTFDLDRFEGNALRFIVFGADGGKDWEQAITDIPIQLSKWNHVVVTWDGILHQINFYINGIKVNASYIQNGNPPSRIYNKSSDLMIGAVETGYTSPDYLFSGTIDEVLTYTRVLTYEEILNLYYYNCDHRELLAYYPFDGNSIDATGNGNDGQVNGPVLTTDRCGNPNSAYLFDGADDYISLNPSYILPESEGTFATWVYFNSVSDVQYLGSIGDIESQDFYLSFVRYDPAYQSFTIYRRTPGNVDILVGSTDISVHQWYFVVMTSDGNDWSLYVNGQKEILSAQRGTNTGDWGLDLPQADNWLLGGLSIQEPHDHAYVNGKLDDIRIYDYPLSQNEILDLFNTNCPMEITGEQLFCQGQQSVLFSVPLIEDLVYSWNYSGTGASLSSNQNQVTINFSDNATSGILSVSAKRSDQTIANSTLDISVLALPADPGLISGPAEACLNDGPYSFLVPEIEYAQDYAWDFSGQDAELIKESNALSVYFFNDATSGSITVTGINQCGQGKTSQPHPVILRNCDIPVVPINIPNSFSPNGDNLNDLFVIRGLREGTAVTIFDSNGKTLYHTDNYNNDWGGIDSDGNIISTGTYWYIIKIPGLSNELKGFLYIKR